jgi:membrane-bound metal-dependent hydrolase YbcI (DUF457 family)
MTFVGHSLAAATVAVGVMPSKKRVLYKVLVLAAFIVIANAPDFRIPNWGHERYDISHSVFVALAAFVVFGLPLGLWGRARRFVGGWRVVIGGGPAWLSHLLLDCFYNRTVGMRLLWPFSDARLALPIPWFETIKKPMPHFDAHTARVCAIELLAYGIVLIVAIAVRQLVLWQARRKSRPLTELT